ncbi:hypothetical protein [Amycolatopsis japonica]
MTGTPDLDIPVLWFSLENRADALIHAAHGRVSNATFHYRAARDVLALSFLVGNQTPDFHLKALAPYLTDSSRWLNWCSSHLARILSELSAADHKLVRNAWRWLTRDRLLIDSMPLCPNGFAAAKGCQVGVEEARQVVDEVIARDQ